MAGRFFSLLCRKSRCSSGLLMSGSLGSHARGLGAHAGTPDMDLGHPLLFLIYPGLTLIFLPPSFCPSPVAAPVPPHSAPSPSSHPSLGALAGLADVILPPSLPSPIAAPTPPHSMPSPSSCPSPGAPAGHVVLTVRGLDATSDCFLSGVPSTAPSPSLQVPQRRCVLFFFLVGVVDLFMDVALALDLVLLHFLPLLKVLAMVLEP